MESKKTKKASSAENTRNSDDVAVDKIKFPLYLYPDTMDIVNALYEHDNCGSKTEFIEKAVRFYCGYLLNWIVNPKLYKNYLAKERALNSTGVK